MYAVKYVIYVMYVAAYCILTKPLTDSMNLSSAAEHYTFLSAFKSLSLTINSGNSLLQLTRPTNNRRSNERLGKGEIG